MKLSRRIRDLRYAKGWGPDDLANRAKISRTALYQIESGKTELPRAATLRRIARALGVAPEVLLQESDARPEPAEGAPAADDHGHGQSHAALTPSPRASLSGSPFTLECMELERKFRVLLASPLRDGLARIVEESYRLLPIEEAAEHHAE